MSKRQIRYRLRLKVEAIEEAREDLGLTQKDFARAAGFGARQYSEKLRETRAGNFPTVTTGMIAGICTVLGWSFKDTMEQIAE